MKRTNTCKAILKMVINIAIGFIIFLLATEFSNVAYRVCDDWVVKGRVLSFIVQVFSELLCLHLYMKYILKRSLKYFYIGRPGLKKGWCVAAFLMPIAVSGFYLLFVPGELGKGNYAPYETAGLLISSILLYGMTSAVTEEMIFRGLIMKSIETVLGKKAAIILSSILFAINHLVIIDTSDIRNIVVLLISITLAGTALALVTYQTGSIWSAVVIHAVYNILGGGSALFSVVSDSGFPAIFSYTIHSDHWLLTGIPGANNPDTALPAMIGFAVVSCIALYQMRKMQKKEKRADHE